LVITYDAGWSPHHPVHQMNESYVPWWSFYLSIYGSDVDIHGEFGEDFDTRGKLDLRKVTVNRKEGDEIYYSYISHRDASMTAWDQRPESKEPRVIELTVRQLAKYSIPTPDCGDFSALLRCISHRLVLADFNPLI
jgi:hypothetical protein